MTPAVCFVRRSMALYTMTGQTLWAAVEAAERQAPLLFVNLPASVEPTERTYPLGFEGVVPLPKRVAASQLIYVHTGQPDAAAALAMGVAATDAPPGYTYRVYGPPGGYEELLAAARQARAVYVARYQPEAIPLVEVGAVGLAVPTAPTLARFEGGLELLAASAACDAGGQVQVRLDWRTPQRVETDVSVFAHLLDEGDALAAQADGYPLAGMAPFWLWQSGETVRDVRTLAAGPGRYRVRLGLWEPATGRRWAVEGAPDGLLYLPVDCP